MAFTGHGHQIAGTPVSGIQPKQVSCCGGASTCVACSHDVVRVLTKSPGGKEMAIGSDELANRFGFHRGTEITGPMHADVRRKFLKLAEELDGMLPDGRAKSTAFTKLDEAAMWSNKAIAEQAPLIVE